jgi:antitoxin component YwqK of YwqJK toxin-antitoxin module
LFTVRHYSDGSFTGRVVQYYCNGSKLVECHLVDGVYQGERYHYLPDGRTCAISFWVDGRQVD